MHLSEKEFIESVHTEDWDYLAKMAVSFSIDFEANSSEMRKLKKRLCVIKHILHEHLKYPEYAEEVASTTVFMGLVKTIDDYEAIAARNNLQMIEFVVFLKALLYKMKKHKLHAHKPLERKVEFKKMKDMFDKFNNGPANGSNGNGTSLNLSKEKLIENGHDKAV